MTDQTGTGISDDNTDEGELETLDVNPNHPWVEASTVMDPKPLPVNVSMAPAEMRVPDENGGEPKVMRAAVLTVVTPAGVNTAFLDPTVLEHLMMQGAQIMDYWVKQDQRKGGLILGTPEAQRQAKAMADGIALITKKN